jgi:hypothetical protein
MKNKDNDTIGFIAAEPMHMGGWKIDNKEIATISVIASLIQSAIDSETSLIISTPRQYGKTTAIARVVKNNHDERVGAIEGSNYVDDLFIAREYTKALIIDEAGLMDDFDLNNLLDIIIAPSVILVSSPVIGSAFNEIFNDKFNTEFLKISITGTHNKELKRQLSVYGYLQDVLGVVL